MVWWSHPSPKRTIYSSLHWSVTKSDERVPNMDWHTDTGFFPFFSLKSSFDNFLWRFHGLTCKKCIFQRGTSWKMKPSLYPWNQGQMATSSQNQAEWRTVWRAGNLPRLTHFSRPGIISNHVKFVLRAIVDGLLVKISDCRAFSPFKTVPGCLVRSVEFPSVDNQAIL